MAKVAIVSVYITSGNRTIAAAWPTAAPDGRHARIDMTLSYDAQVAQLCRALAEVDGHATLFAHSFGAVVAIGALAKDRANVVRLVLVEPALYDIVRGEESIERHIAAVTSAGELAVVGDLYGFWKIIRPVMFGGQATTDKWKSEEGKAAEFASRCLPWGHHIDADVVSEIPTLVVTGDWNQEYEVIATRLAEKGAVHVHLRGNGHRPQDHPGFADEVNQFLARGLA